MTSGTPESNTTAAASGSAHTLNSATGSRLPNVPPPITEMPARRACRSGAVRSASAMFVSGPTATSHVPSLARQVSMMKPTASVPSASRVGAGKSAPSRPLAPWTKPAWRGSATSGRSAPEWTSTSSPSKSRIDTGVVGRPFERCVAGDGRDAEQVGVAGGDDDRHRVVVAGIAVEDDRRSWHDGELGMRCATMNRCDRASSSHVGSVSPPRSASRWQQGSLAARPPTMIPARGRRRPYHDRGRGRSVRLGGRPGRLGPDGSHGRVAGDHPRGRCAGSRQ